MASLNSYNGLQWMSVLPFCFIPCFIALVFFSVFFLSFFPSSLSHTVEKPQYQVWRFLFCLQFSNSGKSLITKLLLSSLSYSGNPHNTKFVVLFQTFHMSTVGTPFIPDLPFSYIFTFIITTIIIIMIMIMELYAAPKPSQYMTELGTWH